jgi:hypothetical protein
MGELWKDPVLNKPSIGGKFNIAPIEMEQGTSTKSINIEPDGQYSSDNFVSKEKLRGSIMETDYQEKYLDARFSHIDESVKDIKTDIREIRNSLDLKTIEMRSEFALQGEKIDHFKYWLLTIGAALIALVFATVSYHVMSMQSQMQVFSECVKAVTQPQVPKTPQK